MTPRSRAAHTGGTRRTSRTAAVLALAVVVLAVIACGGNQPSVAPSASPSDGALGTLGPKATPWPQSVIEAVLALGVADGELWKAGADVARAADAEDVEAMWGAADGTVNLIEDLMSNVDALEAYPHTAPLGAAYRAAFPVMLEGATQIRDSITAGDADGVVAGSQKLSEGVVLYGKVRPMVPGYVNDAIQMKKTLVQ